MLSVCTSLQLAMIWRIYSERFIPSLLALRSICFNSLSVNQNLILSVLFSIIVILSFWGFRGRGKRPPNKCVCGVCTQTRCLLMQCHLQANRIWCTQIQCLLNRCRAARHFWQNAFCFLIKLQCPQRHYLLSEKIAVLPDGVFISPPGISPHSRFARSAFRIHRGKVISPFSRSFNFQGAVISPSTNRQKLKKICIVYEKMFWFNFLFIAVDYFRLSILDCWKNIGKLTPCYQFFLITRAENKKHRMKSKTDFSVLFFIRCRG